MNNQPYDPRYVAGQQGQGYYGGPGQPHPNQQVYPNYRAHGLQTFQNHGYMPQPQQPGYPPNQPYHFHRPLQPNNGYPYQQMVGTPTMPNVSQPQTLTSPRIPQYDGSHSSRASLDMRPQFHQNPMQSPQMRMPTQSPIQQQQYIPPQHQPQYQPPQPPQHSQMRASPVQLQQQMPQRPPQLAQVSAPIAQHSPPPMPAAPPPLPKARQPPSNVVRKKSQDIAKQQKAAPSPKPALKPMGQPTLPAPKPAKPLQQHKTPKSASQKPQTPDQQKTTAAQATRPASQGTQYPDENLVLALAEEYLQAAAKLKKASGIDHPTEEYFELVTMGLTSLKAVFQNSRPKPPVEAAVRLRYASVLFEETDGGDYMSIEETLSHGISTCERNRLFDAKYHMMHLLIRCMFRSKPKAALKYLDERIREVETTRHVAWIYAFRILRASLSVQTSQQQEIYNAITQMKLVCEKAADRGDRAVSCLAAVMEAHIHVSRNNTLESIEAAQRALAVVRSLQVTRDANHVPQLEIMAGFIDVACSMYRADTAQATKVMKATHDELDKLTNSHVWSSGNYIHVPLSSIEPTTAPGSETRESGIIHRNDQGGLSLCVNWLDKEQTYGMAFMLHAITRHHKNASDDANRAEKLLREASDMFEASEARSSSERTNYARRALRVLLLVNKVFEQCSRNRWATAKNILHEILIPQAKDLPSVPGAPWTALYHYLDGVSNQATGNLDDALKAYHHESLALPTTNEYRSPYQRELSLLATMNSLLIIRKPGHPLHSTYAATLESLEPLSSLSPSKNIFSAQQLVRAAMPDLQANVSILDTKGFLQTALQAAKQTSNNQLMCITLNILSYKFFRGVIGDQAEKSGRATQTLARRGKDSLWLSVADGALADTLQGQGKHYEAQVTWAEAVDLAGRLPSNMRGVAEDKGEGVGIGGGLGAGIGSDLLLGREGMELTDQFAM